MNHHILAALLNTPLLATPAKAQAVLSVLHAGGDFAYTGPEMSADIEASAQDPNQRRANPGRTNIAVVQITGSLVHRSRGFGSSSGLRSYQNIKRDLDSALADPEIDGIMLDIDSHGGQVAGCFDLADYIREASAIKPIHAHANESAYSAAYALFSAADRCTLARTSGVGSIGVIVVHADQSKWNKKIGVKYTAVYAGNQKNEFSPHVALSESAKATLQKEVNELRELFVGTVAANMDLAAKAVKATEAGFYRGETAVEIGLAHGVCTWEQAMADLARAIHKNGTQGGTAMTTKERFEALIQGNDDAAAALVELGFCDKAQAEQAATDAAQQAVEEATKAGFADGLNHAAKLQDMANLAKLPEKGLELIRAGADEQQASEQLLADQAKEDERTHVGSTTTPDGGFDKHPFVAACEVAAQGGA